MDRIWAPWRREYILMSKQKGCFICDLLGEGRDPRADLLLHRGRTCVVLLNRYPYNTGHLMVAPCRHAGSLRRLHADERAEMMELTATCMDILDQVMHPDGFNVGYNEGEVAGAGLKDHVHAHIVPRWGGDTNFMPVLGETKVMPQSLGETWDELRSRFAGID